MRDAGRLSGAAATWRPHLYDFLWRVFAWSLLLIVGLQLIAYSQAEILNGWWPAYDTNAYWLAARHVVSGEPLYQESTIWGAGIYKYPPVFAQLAVPVGFLPELVVHWAWRLSGILCLRYLCGSWRLTLIAALQWPVFNELDLGNVTLQLGAVLLFSLRDSRGAYLLPWFAALKAGPGLLMAYLFVTRPAYRRPLLQGCLIFGAACAASLAVAPGLWLDYAGTFGWEAASEMRAMYVLAIVPASGGIDFAIRLGLGLVALGVALRGRRDWLAFVAAAVTMPIFAVTRLSVLVGLWPLWLRDPIDRWCHGEGRLRSAVLELLERLGLVPGPGPGRGPNPDRAARAAEAS